MIKAFQFILCVTSCFLAASLAWAQIVPLNQGSFDSVNRPLSAVPPKPGGVSPLPIGDTSHSQVMAEGKALIFEGNVESARSAALRLAYAEAVSRVAGTEIGSLTIIRNVHKVSDVIMTRSKGFVRNYDVIREGVSASNPRYYEVVIRADVVTKGVSGQDELDGLRLYLELLNNPKLLILLPEQSVTSLSSSQRDAMSTREVEVQSGDTQIRIIESDKSSSSPAKVYSDNHEDELTLKSAEAAMAQAFSRYGYRVMTSDELLASGVVGPEIIAAARRGATQEALMAARSAGAELALIGGMRFSESSVSPYGISLVRVSAEVTAKAIVTSSGRNLAIFHQTYLSASPDRLMAYSHSISKAASGIAEVLAWKIPQVLAQESRETRLIIHGVDYTEAEKIRRALLRKADLDDARLTRLSTDNNQSVELVLLSSFLGVESGHIVDICREELKTGLQIVSSDNFTIELKTK